MKRKRIFEKLWVERLGRLQMLRFFFRVRFGLHTRHPRVHTLPARQIELQSDHPSEVPAEGEPIGKMPIRLGIFPGAFSFAAMGLKD